MTIEDIKQLIMEVIEEARIYGDPYRTSDEYELTPDELTALKSMNHKQRMSFALKKLHQARKEKGFCIQCGKNPPVKKKDGTQGSYCETCLQMFRNARTKLVKKRNSCSRCPNPPLPGQKLCQKCIDELQARRMKALEQGICIKCYKKPAAKPLQVCKDCAEIKADNEKIRKAKRNWSGYEIEESK
jgi:hypothetical protein